MKWCSVVIFSALFVVIAADDPVTSEKPAPTVTVPTTTPKPNVTTPAPITTSTSSPTTSTTTTSPPTTPSPSTSTTTPTSSTSEAPSPTVAPQPGPTKNKYTVTDANGTVCILMEASMQLKVMYKSKNESRQAVIPLDASTTVDTTKSTCNGVNKTEVLALTFATQDSIVFTFRKNTTVYVSAISVEYVEDAKHFPLSDHPGQKVSANLDKLFLYSVLPNNSYLCKRDGPVTLTPNITLDVMDVQLQAFYGMRNKTAGFGAATECSSSDISNIIPIAVGVALAGLVVVVLIAYMIGRRRSRQKGYQSV